MKKNIIVEIEPKSKWTHISVLIKGLFDLSKKKIITLNFKNSSHDNNFLYNEEAGLEIIINGIKCYIDVSDGYNNIDFMKKNASKYYLYFKRSYDSLINKKYGFSNIIPLGLNYEVFDSKINYQFYEQKNSNYIKNILKKILHFYPTIDNYEYSGLYNIKKTKICFTARLWDEKEFDELNNTRIELVRSIKNKYGDRFCGGIYDSSLARKLCPDLIVNKLYTSKKMYLKRMHKCDICIATTGLHKSIGWKFAEYVIAGKTILSEKLNYYVPGNFEKNKNYLEFNSVNECITIIDNLLKDKEKMLKISQNNIKYYNEYLRPDKMMLRVINMVVEKSNS